jgi:aspartate kinase
MEQPVVAGVMADKNQSKITIKGVPDQPGIASNIFGALADNSLPVDMIIQNISDEGHTDISFTLPTTCLNEALQLMEKMAKKIRAQEVSSDSNIAKVSIVGAGMKSHSGVAAKMFSALSRESINLLMISTSEIRVSCVIKKKQAKLAVQALHDEFKLAKDLVKKVKNTKAKPSSIKKKKVSAK